MASQTTNYGFKKPAGSDFYNIEDQNDNWDTADAKIKEAMDAGYNPSTDPVVIGQDAESNTASVAIGMNANAQSQLEVAIGFQANTYGSSGVAIGNQARTNETSTIAIGNKANVPGAWSIAIGERSKANSQNSVAIGRNAATNTTDAVAIGQNANVESNAENGIAIGKNAEAGGLENPNMGGYFEAFDSIALGTNASAILNNGIAIGANARASQRNSIALGHDSRALGENSIALGICRNPAYGNGAYANGINAVSIAGHSNGIDAVAIRGKALNDATLAISGDANGKQSIAIGGTANEYGSTVVGRYGAEANGAYAVAVGCVAQARYRATAIGGTAYATANYAVALGYYAWAQNEYSIVIGSNAQTANVHSIAIGANAHVTNDYSVAIGDNATATTANTIMMGDSNITAFKCKVQVTTTSDERDKADIENIDKATEFLKAIRTITYVRNDRDAYAYPDEKLSETDKENRDKYGFTRYNKTQHKKGTKKGERRRAGVIAQEVRQAMLDVYGDDSYANLVDDNLHNFEDVPEGVESHLGVTYGNFVPFLIKAVQELDARIQELEKATGSDSKK